MTAGDDWATALTEGFAARVRTRREALKWSAQDLSNACAELGYPIPRNVISKLEGGYRRFVTVPEWLVLAAALNIPAPMLLVPLGEDSKLVDETFPDDSRVIPETSVDAGRPGGGSPEPVGQ